MGGMAVYVEISQRKHRVEITGDKVSLEVLAAVLVEAVEKGSASVSFEGKGVFFVLCEAA